MKYFGLLIIFSLFSLQMQAAYMVIPMDTDQKDHLKAYGVTYWVLDKGA